MKKVMILIVGLIFISSCAEDNVYYEKYFIRQYIDPDTIFTYDNSYAAGSSISYLCVIGGDIFSERNDDGKFEYYASKFGDGHYGKKPSLCPKYPIIPDSCNSINVYRSIDFDKNLPEKTNINEIVSIHYTTVDKIVEANFDEKAVESENRNRKMSLNEFNEIPRNLFENTFVLYFGEKFRENETVIIEYVKMDGSTVYGSINF